MALHDPARHQTVCWAPQPETSSSDRLRPSRITTGRHLTLTCKRPRIDRTNNKTWMPAVAVAHPRAESYSFVAAALVAWAPTGSPKRS